MSEKLEVNELANSWSFRTYLNAVKRFKWWILSFSVLGAILGFVGFKFILNPSKEVLTASYTYKLAGEVDDQFQYRLIDGSLFDSYDIISKENMEAVRSSKKEYELVDVSKIYNNGGISINKVIKEPENKNEKTEKLEIYYEIAAKTAFFPSVEIGKAFVYDLIQSPIAISTKAIENFTSPSYITEDFDKEEFIVQTEKLLKQYEVIQRYFQLLEYEFGSSNLVEGKPLHEHSISFSSQFNDGAVSKIEILKGDLLSKYFIKCEEGKETEKVASIDEKCKSLTTLLVEEEKELARTENALNTLSSAHSIIGSDTEYLTTLVDLTYRVKNVKESIDNIKNELAYYGWKDLGAGYEPTLDGVRGALLAGDPDWKAANVKFAETLNQNKVSLLEYEDLITRIYRQMYALYSNKVTILNSGFIAVEHKTSSLIGVAGGLVAFFLLSSIVCTGVLIYKEDKKTA